MSNEIWETIIVMLTWNHIFNPLNLSRLSFRVPVVSPISLLGYAPIRRVVDLAL